MLVSLKWLNEFVRVDDLDPQALADLISLHGVEVESVSKVADVTGVVVGYVESRIQHPDADKLSVCQVNLGSETVQIVCGAANVDAGQKVPVATNGAVLPGNFKIKATKLRGQESNGMICSAGELGIASNAVPDGISEGIWVLPADAPVGECAISYLGLDDTIIELGLTPNRMDMLSMYGVATDVAAILGRKVTDFAKTVELKNDSKDFGLTLATEKCSSYLAKIVKDVTVAPSDIVTQGRLMATGNKPISNIVDLTNKIMLQAGIPIHAFDADKLPTNHITVREAKDGETVVTLDKQERKLEAGDILITSGDAIIAIAGVMGSLSSSVDENTKNIVFEAAIFDRKQIRKTATRLNLRTNASARFEKGLHIGRIAEASALIDAAYPNAVNVLAGNFTADPVAIEISVAEVNAKLGTDFTVSDVAGIFDRLNLTYTESYDVLVVTPNTRMMDVQFKHDLIEEIARIYGFNHLPATLPAMNAIGGLSPQQQQIRNLHQAAQAVGLQNVVTYSLINEDKLAHFLPYPEMADDCVSLAMPLSLDHAHLRKSLIPSLLAVLAYNKARQIKDVFVYEIGKTHGKDGDNYDENAVIAGALTGEITTNRWQQKTEAVDFYIAKGAVDALVAALGFTADYLPLKEGYPEFHPGQTAIVVVDGLIVGVVGKIHPNMKKAYDVNDTFVFELDLTTLLETEATGINYQPVSKYPGISFDIALLVEESLPVAALITTINQAGGDLLTSVEVFDVYTGVGVPAGMKSVAINLQYQDPTKTLTDEDVNPVHENVLRQLELTHEAKLRS